MVSTDTTCLALKMQIAKAIGIEEETSKIQMLYCLNVKTSKGLGKKTLRLYDKNNEG